MKKLVLAGLIALTATAASAGPTREFCKTMQSTKGLGILIYDAAGVVNAYIPPILGGVFIGLCMPKGFK